LAVDPAELGVLEQLQVGWDPLDVKTHEGTGRLSWWARSARCRSDCGARGQPALGASPMRNTGWAVAQIGAAAAPAIPRPLAQVRMDQLAPVLEVDEVDEVQGQAHLPITARLTAYQCEPSGPADGTHLEHHQLQAARLHASVLEAPGGSWRLL